MAALNIELNKNNLSVDTDFVDCNDGHSISLNFDTGFGAEEKFGIYLKDNEWLTLAATYDPFANTLRMSYEVGDINDSEQFEYQPTEAEAQAVKAIISEHIYREYGQTPQEFCQAAIKDNDMEMGGQT